MTISLKHKFTSTKGDGSDPTKVQPSDWNDNHDLTMATGRILGRLTAGSGAAEEIPITSYMAGLLAATSADDFFAKLGRDASRVGDIKYSFVHDAAPGWITIYGPNQTIGNATSGATNANANTQALYTALWDYVSAATCPVLTSAGAPSTRGASAAADWGANKRLVLPEMSSRVIVGAGTGTGLSGYSAGTRGGVESVTLTESQIPSHTHNNAVGEPGGGHSHTFTSDVTGPFQLQQGNGGLTIALPYTAYTSANFANVFILNAAAGGGGAHTNVQPYIAMYAQIKL